MEQVSLLPQYEKSDMMYECFLDDILNESEEIYRAKKKPGTKIARVDKAEESFDNLIYFTEPNNKKKIEDEFFSKLIKIVGKDKAELFCELIRDYWYDGRTKRLKSPEILALKKSIQNYLLEYRKVTNVENIRVINQVQTNIAHSFEDDEIEAILNLNMRMLEWHLTEWLSSHPNFIEMSSNDIYFRRGIYLNSRPDKTYNEWLYINSYSLAFTVSEKFVGYKKKKIPIILNMNFGDLRERILFFSPFIKGMPPFQLEAGIIPHYYDLETEYQGTFGGIEEYLLHRGINKD